MKLYVPGAIARGVLVVCCGILVCCAIGVFAVAEMSIAFAQRNGGERLYIVTYVDIFPDNGGTENGTAILRQFANDSRKDSGCERFELLRDVGRANHFSIVEVWRNRQAWESHLGLPHTRRFREQLQPLLGSPFDQRLYHALG